MNDNLEKKEALDKVLATIEKQYGEGSIMKLGQDAKLNIDSIPTGALALDIALGIGGIPKGRIIEILFTFTRKTHYKCCSDYKPFYFP